MVSKKDKEKYRKWNKLKENGLTVEQIAECTKADVTEVYEFFER